MNLTEAIKIHKYGDLRKWSELFFYQRHCNDPDQVKQISDWAKRFNRGEVVYLPLRLNLTQKQVPLIERDKTVELASELFA